MWRLWGALGLHSPDTTEPSQHGRRRGKRERPRIRPPIFASDGAPLGRDGHEMARLRWQWHEAGEPSELKPRWHYSDADRLNQQRAIDLGVGLST